MRLGASVASLRRMRYAFPFAVFVFASIPTRVPAIAQTMPLEFPLQKTESRIGSDGCLKFDATAVVGVQIENLFDALSRPEELYSGFHSVFVIAPETPESPLQNTWTLRSPFAKIIEDDGPRGLFWPAGGPPKTWVKYTFVSETHTILEHTIGSTFVNSRRDARLVLSPTLGRPATFIRYSSSECWPPESVVSSRQKLGRGEEEKLWLGHWLKLADADARLIAKERLKATPVGTSSPSPAVLSATPTPISQ